MNYNLCQHHNPIDNLSRDLHYMISPVSLRGIYLGV